MTSQLHLIMNQNEPTGLIGDNDPLHPRSGQVPYIDEGPEVQAAQEAVERLGYPLAPYGADGHFGDVSENTFIRFQTDEGLKPDGVVGGKTWMRLRQRLLMGNPHENVIARIAATVAAGHEKDAALAPDRLIPLQGLPAKLVGIAGTYNRFGGILRKHANRLEIPVSRLLAFLAVESNGNPYGEDGRPLIRVELHKVYKLCRTAELRKQFAEMFTFDDRPNGQPWKRHYFREEPGASWQRFHGDNELEWKVYEKVCELVRGAATTASIGLGQVMISYHDNIGYKTPEAMVEACMGAEAQIGCMMAYLEEVAPVCIDGFHENDMVRVAAAYNGTGQKFHYGELLTNAVANGEQVLRLVA